MKTKGLIYPTVKSSDGRRRNEREKRIENEYNRETRGYFLEKEISSGPKGIVAIRTSMGAADFQK